MKTSICLLLLSALCFAGKTKHAPLPDALMSAKTVYIDNQTGDSKTKDLWYQGLTEWGRFNVVADPKVADVVFRITGSSEVTGYNTTGTSDTDAKTRVKRKRATTLEVIDAKSQLILWSDTKDTGDFHVTAFYHHSSPGTNAIIKELRKRIEEQESQKKAQH